MGGRISQNTQLMINHIEKNHHHRKNEKGARKTRFTPHSSSWKPGYNVARNRIRRGGSFSSVERKLYQKKNKTPGERGIEFVESTDPQPRPERLIRRIVGKLRRNMQEYREHYTSTGGEGARARRNSYHFHGRSHQVQSRVGGRKRATARKTGYRTIS